MLPILTALVITSEPARSWRPTRPRPPQPVRARGDFVVSREMMAALEARDAMYGYDVDHYDLDLAVDFTNQTVSGTGTMSVTITEPDLSVRPRRPQQHVDRDRGHREWVTRLLRRAARADHRSRRTDAGRGWVPSSRSP